MVWKNGRKKNVYRVGLKGKVCVYVHVCLFLTWGKIGSDSFILDVTKNRLHSAESA